MFLELSEVLVCPRCRPVQGLIVMVSELRDRRVLEGHLGCPECEARYPIRGGVIEFDASPGETERASESTAAADRSGSADPELATELAALLGLQREGGIVYLGAGLARVADRVAAQAPGTEFLVAHGTADSRAPAPAASRGEEGGGVSRARGLAPGDLPVCSGRLRGVALPGDAADAPSTAELTEAIRILAPEGRLVVLRPAPGTRDRLSEHPVEVVAAGERALVAARTP